jgi:hypothetical protein
LRDKKLRLQAGAVYKKRYKKNKKWKNLANLKLGESEVDLKVI